MVMSFDRPTGAPADVAELEYVSALHQTAPEARMDGTLDAADIRYYLRSRFGVQVSLETVRTNILQGLGGSDQSGEVIDIMELTAILLIPYLVKTAKLQRGETLPAEVAAPSPHTLKHVCDMIVHDIFLNEQSALQEDDKSFGSRLTPDLIRRILSVYGEVDLANNEALIQRMHEQVAGYERFDANALLTACTADVRLYDPSIEVKYTTIYDTIMNEDAEEVPSLVGNGSGILRNNAGATTNTSINVISGVEDSGEPTNDSNEERTPDEIERSVVLPTPPELTHVYSAPAIDSTADTMWSKSLLVLLWAGVLFSYFAFSLDIGLNRITELLGDCPEFDKNGTWGHNWGTLTCSVSFSVIRFLVAFSVLCIFGMTYIGIGSIGNSAGNKQAYKPVVASIILIAVVLVPDIEHAMFAKRATTRYLVVMAMIFTIMAIFLHWTHAVYLWLPSTSSWKAWIQKKTMRAEVDLKTSMGYKVNQLVKNALEIHHSEDEQHVVRACFAHALHVFSKWKRTERVGSLLWFWQGLWSGDIARREGVSYSSRLVASNVAQFAVVLFIVMAFLYAQRTLAENYDKESARGKMREYVDYIFKDRLTREQIARIFGPIVGVMASFIKRLWQAGLIDYDCQQVADIGSVCPNAAICETTQADVALCSLIERKDLSHSDQFTLLAGIGMDVETLVKHLDVVVSEVLDFSMNTLYPDEVYMLSIPLTIATVVSVLSSLYLALGYLPSITSTTLQLRTGVIPTLGDKMLNEYRVAPDTVTLLTGSLFWGCLFAGVLSGALMGLVAFFFLWQGSIYFAQRFMAIFVGVFAIGVIRYLAMFVGRVNFFRGFYRKKPAGANIYFLAMDWAAFGLAAGFVFVRMIKLLVLTAFSVGRIDTYFLAKGVGQVGPYQFDPFPIIHTREILSHDAHRHPYIEIIGSIYLMKLRYGTKFASNAGSCWRLILVYALMPWLTKYRVFACLESKKEGVSITEDDFSALMIENLSANTHERSSFLVTPALLKSITRGSHVTQDTSTLNLLSLRTENEILRNRMEEIEASKKHVDGENEILRMKVAALERLFDARTEKDTTFDAQSDRSQR